MIKYNHYVDTVLPFQIFYTFFYIFNQNDHDFFFLTEQNIVNWLFKINKCSSMLLLSMIVELFWYECPSLIYWWFLARSSTVTLMTFTNGGRHFCMTWWMATGYWARTRNDKYTTVFKEEISSHKVNDISIKMH